MQKMGLEFFRNLTNQVRKEVLTPSPKGNPLGNQFETYLATFKNVSLIFCDAKIFPLISDYLRMMFLVKKAQIHLMMSPTATKKDLLFPKNYGKKLKLKILYEIKSSYTAAFFAYFFISKNRLNING